jgi:hypothetical protein
MHLQECIALKFCTQIILDHLKVAGIVEKNDGLI